MEYTWAAIVGVVAVVLLELLWLRTGIFRTATFWIAYGIIVFFQVLVDGWLTKLSAPIVLYNPDEFTGWRAPFDIPVEDYLFGFALVTLTILLWVQVGLAVEPRTSAAQRPAEQEQRRAPDDDHLAPQGGQGQGREPEADAGEDDPGGPLAGGDDLACRLGRRSASEPRARTYSSHQQTATVATASSPAAGRRRRWPGPPGRAASARRSRAESSRKPDLGRAPRLHRHRPVEGVEQAGDDDGEAGGGGADPAVDRGQGDGATATTKAATVTVLGETPARARGRAMAAVARSHPPTKPAGGSVRCRLGPVPEVLVARLAVHRRQSFPAVRPSVRRRRPSLATAASLAGLARMGLAARRFLRPDPAAPADRRAGRDPGPGRGGGDRRVRGVGRSARPPRWWWSTTARRTAPATLAAAAGARVVRLDGDPPPGWLGKPRACLAGRRGRDDRVAGVRRRRRGAPPVGPGHHGRRHPSRRPPASSAAWSAGRSGSGSCCPSWDWPWRRRASPPTSPAASASSSAGTHYEAVGGHGHPSVRGSVVDDRDLARALGGHDARLAPTLMRARMYRDLGGDPGRAWSRTRPPSTRRPLRHLAGLLVPVATRRPWAAMVVSAGGRAVAGQNPAYGLLAPLARLVLAAFHVESRWRARTGRPVEWKGRRVPTSST